MDRIIIKGRPTYKGIAKGEALVCTDSIAGNTGGLGDLDGVIYEERNPLKGMSIKNKILVIPCAKGSTGFSAHFKSAKIAGVCPAGWVVSKIDSRIGVAITSLGVPAVSDFENVDPMDIIQTGDLVTVDGDTGVVVIDKVKNTD